MSPIDLCTLTATLLMPDGTPPRPGQATLRILKLLADDGADIIWAIPEAIALSDEEGLIAVQAPAGATCLLEATWPVGPQLDVTPFRAVVIAPAVDETLDVSRLLQPRPPPAQLPPDPD